MKNKTIVLILLCTLCFTSCAKKNDSLLTIRLCESRQIDLIEKDGYIYMYFDDDACRRLDISEFFWFNSCCNDDIFERRMFFISSSFEDIISLISEIFKDDGFWIFGFVDDDIFLFI